MKRVQREREHWTPCKVLCLGVLLLLEYELDTVVDCTVVAGFFKLFYYGYPYC